MRDVTQLHPYLQMKVARLFELCEAQGLVLGIAECFRTVEEQDELYAQGRTKPGPIVTYAKGSSYQSQHQWGIAFDFFQNIPGHAYDDTSFFVNVGTLAKGIGLAWGGDWTDFVDLPHLYLPDWGDTPAQLKAEYGTFDEFKETWPDPLKKDGIWGPVTTTYLQNRFGTFVDGIISSQMIEFKEDNPGIVCAEWVEDASGSRLVRTMQEWLGVEVDGLLGPVTISALQTHFGTPVDGCVSNPSKLVKAMQKWLNEYV